MLMTDTAAPRDVSRSGSRLLCRPSELLFPPSCHGRRRRKDGGGREREGERERERKETYLRSETESVTPLTKSI